MNIRLPKFLTPARIVIIVIVCVLFWSFVLSDKGVNKLRRLIEMKHSLIADRSKLNDDIDKLNEEKQTLSDPKNLEMVIRNELGYIKPGEIVFEKKAENPVQ